MSGVSSLGASGANSYAWFSQMISQESQQSPGTTTASSALDTAGGSGSSSDATSSQSLQSQIKAAILSALQTAEQSGDSTSFQTIIKNAVDQTLQANGINIDASQQQSQSAGDSSTSSADSTGSTADTTGSSSTTASTASLNQQIEAAIVSALQNSEASDDSTSLQTIIKNAVDQTLQANGINIDASQQQSQSADGGMGGIMGMPPPPPPSDSSTSGASSSSGSADSTDSASATASMESLNQQIETAVVSALQNAESSGDTTSFQTIIGNAVQQTLQANGIGAAATTTGASSAAGSSSATTPTSASSSAASTSSSVGAGMTDIDQLVQTLQQLFSEPGSGGNGQILGLFVDTQS